MASHLGSAGRRSQAPPCDPDDIEAAGEVAVRILNAAAQSSAGLAARLRRRGFSAETVAAVVARMVEFGYVDDTAFATSIVRRSQHSGHGRARIAAELRSRQIDANAIETALGTIDSTLDIDLALSVARRTWRHGATTAPELMRLRRRVAGQLQRRGFGGDIIAEVLRRLAVQ